VNPGLTTKRHWKSSQAKDLHDASESTIKSRFSRVDEADASYARKRTRAPHEAESDRVALAGGSCRAAESKDRRGRRAHRCRFVRLAEQALDARLRRNPVKTWRGGARAEVTIYLHRARRRKRERSRVVPAQRAEQRRPRDGAVWPRPCPRTAEYDRSQAADAGVRLDGRWEQRLG